MKKDADQDELDKPTEEFTSLSDAFFTCLLEIISTQLFDKTFVLVVIFTIGWSGYNDGKQPDDSSHLHKDKSMHFVAKFKGSSAIRIFFASTIGTCVTSIVSFYLYRQLYLNITILSTGLFLAIMMIHYLYDMCYDHLTNLSNLEKEQIKTRARKNKDVRDTLSQAMQEKKLNAINIDSDQRRLCEKLGAMNIQEQKIVDIDKIASEYTNSVGSELKNMVTRRQTKIILDN